MNLQTEHTLAIHNNAASISICLRQQADAAVRDSAGILQASTARQLGQGTEFEKQASVSATVSDPRRAAPLVLTRARGSNASARPPSCIRREPAIPTASLGGISPQHLLGSTRARPGPETGAPGPGGQAACLHRRRPRPGEEAPVVPGTLPSFPRSIRSASAEGVTRRR